MIAVTTSLTTGHYIIITVLVTIWYVLLRPRCSSQSNAPPLVTSSNNGIPIIGHLIEFFSSPHVMMKRCYAKYGSVFTIPVRTTKSRKITTKSKTSLSYLKKDLVLI
jgi:hypothetical protein